MFNDEIFDILYFGYPLNPNANVQDGYEREYDFEFSLKNLKNRFLNEIESLIGDSDQVILPLSGGLDSRLILSLLLEFVPAKNIHAFNYGCSGFLDFEIAPIIAKKAGIHFKQVNYSEISIDKNVIIDGKHSIHETPSHNIIGFYVTKLLSELGLDKLGVGEDLSVFSGFLGDRIFTGMWSHEDSMLGDSCDKFTKRYAINRKELFPESYRPDKRLYSMYEDKELNSKFNWNEKIEYEQRQSRVKCGLQVLNNEYKYLFNQKNIIQSLLSISPDIKRNGKLQRKFLMEIYPDLFSLPVTSRFGCPLRRFIFLEKLDRYNRLILTKVDNFLGSSFQKFKRTQLTSKRLGQLIGGYEEVLEFGSSQAREKLVKTGIEFSEKDIKSLTQGRTRAEQFSSLGYLL